MWEWLRNFLSRLFQRWRPTPQEPYTLGAIPDGEEAERDIRTALVNNQRLEKAQHISRQSPDLSLSQAHAALSFYEEGPRAEFVIQPKDGLAIPVLPADLAPETIALSPLRDEDIDATRRLPSLSTPQSNPTRAIKRRGR
jgi:hypothetical protein